MTKRTAKGLLANDLQELRVAFISTKDVKKHIERMQSEFKRSDNLLNLFWSKHSDTLKIMALENSVEANVVEKCLKRKAVSSIVQSSPSSASSLSMTTEVSEESSRRMQLRQRRKTNKDEGRATVNDSNLVESDEVFVTDCNLSVGTIIKRAAYELHQRSNQKMTCRERKIMTSGLSSILDLSDDSFDSQRSLFNSEQWDELHKKFDPKFDNPLYQLDSDVVAYLKIACCTLELSNDYDCVIKFLRKSQDQLNSVSCVSLKIAEIILNLTKSYQYLLQDKSTKNVTELDYYCTIWSPIFLLLFPPSGNVRVKAGESINTSSAVNKKELYNESAFVKAFKIDFRFIADLKGEEYDLGVGECASKPMDSKAIKDEGKLTREAKDAVDKVLKVVKEDVDTKIWMLQTTGSACSISLLDLLDVGFYVANHKYTFKIPSTVTEFVNNINLILRYLLTMQREVNKLANSVVSHMDVGGYDSFNRNQDRDRVNPRLVFTRDTYYTPPKGSASKLPSHYYGPPPPSILSTLQALFRNENAASAITSEDTDEVYDLYGYRAMEDGKFYNKYTKLLSEVHPML